MSDYSSNFPTQSPTFVFDAKAGKLDSRLSYSRSSGGTYMSSEKALNSDNLLLQSQNFDTTWANDGGVGLTASQTAPDGTSTAWLLTASSGSSISPRLSQSVSISSPTQYTTTVHVKAGTASHAYVSLRGAASNYAYAQLDFASPSSVTTGGAGFTSISGTVTALGSNWYKLTLTATSSSSSSSFAFIGLSDGTAFSGSGYPNWSPAGTETLYAWGAQLSSTNSKVYDSPTTTQISREYSPLLKTASADEPRFEFASDGQSDAGSPRGILIEAQATNLQRYGSDFASWDNKRQVSVSSNVATAPSGTLEADLIIADGTLDGHYLFDNAMSFTSGNVNTASVYAKDAGQRYVQLNGSAVAFGSSQYATFDLQTGSVDANGVTASAVSVGNGWYRIQATFTATITASARLFVSLADSATATRSPVFTGNNFDGILLWGWQNETGSAASSLVDTGTGSSQLSRAADSCSVALSQINYSGGEVSLLGEGTSSDQTDYRGMFSLHLDSSNFISLYAHSEYNRRVLIKADGVGSELSGGAGTKAGLSFDTNDVSFCLDGGAVTADTSQTIPNLTGATAYIGSWSATSHHLNGHIKRVSLYSAALSDVELQSLTSS